MTQLQERTRPAGRSIPEPTARKDSRGGIVPALRTLGALAVLLVGAIHLEQYFDVHFDVVPVIGPLFLLNFIGATAIGIGLLIPSARMRLLHLLLALGGIGLAATSFAFLVISEHRSLFGFRDYGYRPAIIIALAAEAAAVVLLGGHLVRRRERQ